MKSVKYGMIIIILPILLCVCMTVPAIAVSAAKIYTEQEIMSVAEGIINWKKLDNGSTVDGNLINNAYLEMAGSTPGDWYQIGMSRLGIEDDYDAYLAVVKQDVQDRYKEPGKLSSAKATEWQRISLAVLASGGDPTAFGQDENGKPINLIADGTYDRGKTTTLGRQGINGWIWGLIALDSMRYPVPDGAFNTRDDIIVEIIRQQLKDGGFALTGANSDVDISAMALQALAPYYGENKPYTYTQKAKGSEVTKTVKQIVDETIIRLSSVQTKDGDFFSWGTENVESTVQTVVALCSLGIDPQADERFIKNGKTMLDGIMKYRMPDGGFVHSFTYDDENPTSLPDKSNTMASEQALYGMAAILRQMKGMRTLYDFRPESDVGPTGPVIFTDADKSMADNLPKQLTTGQYVAVVKLLEKLTLSEDFNGKAVYKTKLEDSKTKIAEIQTEIDALNAFITEKLYPFESMSLKDKDAVDEAVRRYDALSDYDKQKILRYEDVIKTRTQIYNLQRAIIISVVLGVVVIIGTVLVVYRIRVRRRKKLAQKMLDIEDEDLNE